MSDPRYKTEYGISRLIRYNGKRKNFFDGLHRIVLFINAVAGSSAFVATISDMPKVTLWLTAFIAIFSALDNVVGFSDRARKYAEQRSRYYDLYCELLATKQNDFDEATFKEKRLRIDRDSSPPKRVLDIISRNEEDISRGYAHEETIYIGRIAYMFRHIVDLPPKKWVTIEDRQKEKSKRSLFRSIL